ncbi:MAG: SDR family NAD(P)-dependent oxidoreductase, partial [Pseudomonadota bacterium]
MKIDSSVSALVTGGASGLGAATARMLARHGAKVAVLDVSEEKGAAVASEIGGMFAKCDVTDEASCDAALAAAREAHGQERILINCAGVAPGKRMMKINRETGEKTEHDVATFALLVIMRNVPIRLISTARAKVATSCSVFSP